LGNQAIPDISGAVPTHSSKVENAPTISNDARSGGAGRCTGLGTRGVDDHGTSHRHLDRSCAPTFHDSPKLVGFDEQCSLNEQEQCPDAADAHGVLVRVSAA